MKTTGVDEFLMSSDPISKTRTRQNGHIPAYIYQYKMASIIFSLSVVQLMQ